VRKMISCVLMMTLLLTGCGRDPEDSPENLAAQIRGEYLNLRQWSAEVTLCADYGEQVFDFTANVTWEREGETVIVITGPELIAGITARIREGETFLEYDGAGLSLGMLDLSGLTPVSAVPALMECITTGYMARCSWQGEGETRMLSVLCSDPAVPLGKGVEYTLLFDPESHALIQAEVSVDGTLRLRAEFSDFTMELNDDDTGTDQNLG